MEENWPAIEEFLDACDAIVGGLVAEGQASGEFGPGDPALLGKMTMAACAAIHHPTLIAQCAATNRCRRRRRGASSPSRSRALANKNPAARSAASGVSVMRFVPVVFALLPALAPRRLQRADARRKGDAAAPGAGRRRFIMRRAPSDRVLPGIVKARIESDLAFRVSGKIAERLVDAGADRARRAMRWRGSTTPIFACRSIRPRPIIPRPRARSIRRRPRSSGSKR